MTNKFKTVRGVPLCLKVKGYGALLFHVVLTLDLMYDGFTMHTRFCYLQQHL